MSKVLLISRPINNNFDEGTKNLVSYIVKNSTNQDITFLSYKDNKSDIENNNSLEIYSKKLPFFINRFLLIKIISKIKNFDVIHFFYTPSLINLIFIYVCRVFSDAKFIHSVPTANKNSLKIKLLGKLFICDVYITQSDLSSQVLKNLNKEIKIFKINPIIDVPTLQKQNRLNNNIIYPGDYRLNKVSELLKLSFSFAKQKKYKLVIAFRINKFNQNFKNILFKFILKIFFLKNVEVYNRVDNISRMYSESACVIFPATKMKNKIDIPHSVIEPLFLRVPVIVNNIGPLNELDENLQFDFFSVKNLFNKLDNVVENQKLVFNNFHYAEKLFGKSNVIKYREFY